MVQVPDKIREVFEVCDGFIDYRDEVYSKPVIGISANRAEGTSRVADAYINSVVKAGCVPLIIPGFADLELLSQICDLCDGILLTGAWRSGSP